MLAILKDLFNELNAQNIRYIHWKSNEHLQAAINGDTDLDIMVHVEDKKKFVQIIQSHGFSLYQSVGKQSYISISDYIYLDAASQKILHIHLHNYLMIGRKFFKEYLIPIEKNFFEDSIFDPSNTVKIMTPSQELIVLWMRYALKTSLLKFILKRFKISKDFLKESTWLEDKLCNQQIAEAIEKFGLIEGTKLLSLYKHFFDTNKGTKETIKLIYGIRRALKKYKTEYFTGVRYLFVRINMIFKYILQNKLNKPIPYRRINPSGGTIIAIIGSDGSGKSTVIHSMKKTIERKLDVYIEYLGSGDGKSSLLRAPMQVIKNLKKRNKETNKTVVSNFSKLSTTKVVWAIVLAFEKKNKLKRIWKAKARGMVVICDRYPQSEVLGINDGPLLFSWVNSDSKLKRKIARWEKGIYEQAKILKPDLIVKLLISPEIAIKRKPEENLDNINQKVKIIEEIKIPANNTIKIDASKPLERVLNDVYFKLSSLF
ncbi:MAG: hypothetical protein L0L22_08615 [Staphylococcus equorum]|nr:hypothetical protein [Staphylococcus equorum]